jgi:hypothetical protein
MNSNLLYISEQFGDFSLIEKLVTRFNLRLEKLSDVLVKQRVLLHLHQNDLNPVLLVNAFLQAGFQYWYYQDNKLTFQYNPEYSIRYPVTVTVKRKGKMITRIFSKSYEHFKRQLEKSLQHSNQYYNRNYHLAELEMSVDNLPYYYFQICGEAL